MRQRADRYQVHSRFGYRANRFERHAARNLELDVGAGAHTRPPYVVKRHVVEQDGFRARRARFIDLRKRLALHLDEKRVWREAARALDGPGDRSCRRDVVVLDQDSAERPKRWLFPPPARTAYFSS